MSTINEDVSAIKTIQDGLVNNKVARFSYTQKAYIDNIVDGVDTYNVNNEQNIPNGTAEIMKVNDTIINKGYRAQASSITRMLMNHFLGRISYNLNKVNDNMKSLIDSLNSHLGKKNGIATLDANAKLPKTQLPDILGKANGIATLDANAKLPKTQLPDILGKANGIATLDANAKLPQTQLPDILGKKNGIATLDSDGKLKLEQSPVSRFTLIKAFKNITGTGSSINFGVITPDGLDYLPVGLYMINISGGSGEEFYLPFAILEIKTQVESIYFDDRFETEIAFRPDGGKIKPFLFATFSSSYPAKIYIYKIG